MEVEEAAPIGTVAVNVGIQVTGVKGGAVSGFGSTLDVLPPRRGFTSE
jgi:hypothetical protein